MLAVWSKLGMLGHITALSIFEKYIQKVRLLFF